MITGEQIKAARKLLGWSAATLAIKSRRSIRGVARAERSTLAHAFTETSLRAIQATLERAGVEFVEGEQPGVSLRKVIHMEIFDQQHRAEVAKAYAREWTAYCVEQKSMAFASASGDQILIQFRKFSGETLNLLTLRIIDLGFEIDGQTVGKNEMLRIVFKSLDSKRL